MFKVHRINYSVFQTICKTTFKNISQCFWKKHLQFVIHVRDPPQIIENINKEFEKTTNYIKQKMKDTMNKISIYIEHTLNLHWIYTEYALPVHCSDRFQDLLFFLRKNHGCWSLRIWPRMLFWPPKSTPKLTLKLNKAGAKSSPKSVAKSDQKVTESDQTVSQKVTKKKPKKWPNSCQHVIQRPKKRSEN